MDQDSFRHLLETSNGNKSSSTLGISSSSRSKLSVPSKQTVLGESSKPAFKPRNIKKPQESSHGGRTTDGSKAGIGRGRTNNEEVDKIGEHSQPVKGLDFALLEQEKAKAGLLSKADVDELEQAFAEHSSQQSERVAPKKRTREEIIRELKQKRAQEAGQAPRLVEEEAKLLEDAKQKGKFKPIGFKPINSSSTGKKRKGDGDSEKKKKQKVEDRKQGPKEKPSTPSMAGVKKILPLQKAEVFTEPSTGSKDIDEDFDIFAGAGEYTGVEIDDDDEEINENRSQKNVRHDGDQPATSILPQKHWIAMDDELGEIPQTRQIIPPPPTNSQPDEDQETEEKLLRLAPLESSAVPSIKDLLEMDNAAGKYERKQKRKEKKSKKKGKGAASDGE